jgi:pyrroline-5-carboxylate reductase
MLANQHVAFIGGGHISEIIIHNLIQRQVVAEEQIIVSDPEPSRRQHLFDRFGITIAANNVEAAQRGDLVMICVRPEVVRAILPDLQAARLRPDQVIVTVAAGIPLSTYRPLGDQQPLVRALPNPPSQVGQGISPLVFAGAVNSEQRGLVLDLFSALGDVLEVEESYLDAITSLSSPVTTYLYFQSLIDAGVACGLPRAVATQVAAQTITGSMAVWQARQIPPSELIREASTPGGVSVESLHVLEQREFKAAVADAIAEGAVRATQLGRDSREPK